MEIDLRTLKAFLSSKYNLNNKLNNQIMIKYRNRDIESNYYWISDYKEFNKYEIIYKISFSSDLDLLY